MEPIPRRAKNYRTAAGKSPFREWLQQRVTEVRNRVNIRIRRIEELGSYGDFKLVGNGVFELRFDFGPGYRVYFGIDGEEIILLGGGDKNTQPRDIKRCQEFWEDYNA
ncbi:MAG: type II toxin-antitoxin system RelE/ParE family toxin [Bryobacteraceae bacterium]